MYRTKRPAKGPNIQNITPNTNTYQRENSPFNDQSIDVHLLKGLRLFCFLVLIEGDLWNLDISKSSSDQLHATLINNAY